METPFDSLWCNTVCYTTQHYTILHHTTLHCTSLHHTALPCTTPYDTTTPKHACVSIFINPHISSLSVSSILYFILSCLIFLPPFSLPHSPSLLPVFNLYPSFPFIFILIHFPIQPSYFSPLSPHSWHPFLPFLSLTLLLSLLFLSLPPFLHNSLPILSSSLRLPYYRPTCVFLPLDDAYVLGSLTWRTAPPRRAHWKKKECTPGNITHNEGREGGEEGRKEGSVKEIVKMEEGRKCWRESE